MNDTQHTTVKLVKADLTDYPAAVGCMSGSESPDFCFAEVFQEPIDENVSRMIDAWNNIDRLREVNKEMLAALKDALKELYRVSPSHASPIVRAAIAKTEGG